MNRWFQTGGVWGPRILSAIFCTAFLGVVATLPYEMPRCPEGMVARGARCCGEGQTVRAGRCVGRAVRCAAGLEARENGCVAPRRRILIVGGDSAWRPPDTLIGEGERASTTDFLLDRTEVTWADWRRCEQAKVCSHLSPASGGDDGQAVHGVTRAEARTYCLWEQGHLVSDAEWLRAAIGDVELRYPWGDPDALCLRAAYGLISGPCAFGAVTPDTAGARPWGATPAGVLDLAGNVAEWVDDGAPAGQAAVRGGSFVEDDATTLRARWRRVLNPETRAPWIGFRCAYPSSALTTGLAPH